MCSGGEQQDDEIEKYKSPVQVGVVDTSGDRVTFAAHLKPLFGVAQKTALHTIFPHIYAFLSSL